MLPYENTAEIVRNLTEQLTARVILDGFAQCESLEDFKYCLKKYNRKYNIENPIEQPKKD